MNLSNCTWLIIRSLLLISAGLMWQSGIVSAQPSKAPPPLPLFEKTAPQIGEQLPDLTIVDDAGNPVNIRELAKENYKVLVVGCLT